MACPDAGRILFRMHADGESRSKFPRAGPPKPSNIWHLKCALLGAPERVCKPFTANEKKPGEPGFLHWRVSG